MPARKIKINGVSNSFEWQVGNTTRFIKFNTVTDVEYKEDCSTFDVYCGQTIVSVPNELREQFKAKYEEWKKTKMKNYKIGDTIYIKDQIVAIDTDPCTHSKYCTIDKRWVSNTAIIDELPTAEPVKPALPEDVADEMSYAKSIKDITFDDYIIRELIYSGYDDSATKIMIQSHDVPNAMEALLNAWNNGYTIAAEPKYYVYIALPYNTDIGGKYYDNDGDFYDCGQLWRNSTDRLCSRAAVQAKLYTADRYQFTKEEIDQLRKDYPAIEIKEVNIDD